MWGIVWRYLPRGSWKMQEKIYDDREKADAEALALDYREEVKAKVIHLGDPIDWNT